MSDATSTREPRPLPRLSPIVRFLLAGGTAALVNFGARVLFSIYLPYAVAIVLAYVLGMATAFLLNRRYVFRGYTNRLHQQVVRFIAVNALALLQTLGVSLLLADIVFPRVGLSWHAQEIAHAVGIVVPIFTSYLGHKKWTFR
jgi:putative flippase GtrA